MLTTAEIQASPEWAHVKMCIDSIIGHYKKQFPGSSVVVIAERFVFNIVVDGTLSPR